MLRRTFLALVASAGSALAAPNLAMVQTESDAATPRAEGEEMTQPVPQTGYAPVNGLQMYYEIHGNGGVPVVLLHGAYMNTGAMEVLLSALAKTRQVIATDLQGHG